MNLFKALVLSAMFVGFSAQANEYLYCQNGPIEVVGDSHYAISILEDGINFHPYEAGYTVDAANVFADGRGSFVILNQVVQGSVEGENFTVLVDAMLILKVDEAGAYTLKATVSTDKLGFESYDLTCETKTAE